MCNEEYYVILKGQNEMDTFLSFYEDYIFYIYHAYIYEINFHYYNIIYKCKYYRW